MPKGEKRKVNQTNAIKVVVKKRPTKEQATLKLKRLGEFLSANWQKDCD